MNQKPSFTFRLAAMLMLHAMLVLTVLAPYQMAALDVQTLPTDTRATSGFTHAARVTWDDLNAADASVVAITLFAQATNTFIDRVAYYIEEAFTNTVAAGTNLSIHIGITGTTNKFVFSNCIDGATTVMAHGKTVYTFTTNVFLPHRAVTDGAPLIATFGGTESSVDNYTAGKIRIYWRVVEPVKYKF